MTIEKYHIAIDIAKREFNDLIKQTQKELNSSTSKVKDFAILSCFMEKLVNNDKTYEFPELQEIFTDHNSMLPMPESTQKQFVSILFKIKHLNVLFDLNINDSLDLEFSENLKYCNNNIKKYCQSIKQIYHI